MKIKTIVNNVAEIEKSEQKRIDETNTQIAKLKDRLVKVNASIEKSYIDADIDNGQKLIEEKTILEAKINFLEDFLKKRKTMPVISETEGTEYKKEINDELFSMLFDDLKSTDEAFVKLRRVAEKGTEIVQDAVQIGNRINKLQHKENTFFNADNKVNTLYNFLNEIIERYDKYARPYIVKKEK